MIVAGCTTPGRFAREFSRSPQTVQIAVLTTQRLFYAIKNSSGNCPSALREEADSCLLSKSVYLKHIEGKTFLTDYYNALSDELKSLGFNVLDENQMETLFSEKSSRRYIISIAQTELEEYTTSMFPEGDNQNDGQELIDHCALNTWFEVTILDDTVQGMKVVYTNTEVADSVQVHTQEAGESGYFFVNYELFKMTLPKVENLARTTGKKDANAIFDYLMNQYMRSKSKLKNAPNLHFDPRNRWVYRPDKALYTEMSQ
ncbi:MAG: hypothetical protein KKD31_03265 [Bacteroidetes bacterium]|nr:hypothetical protein [Bacteroidota bacterium]